MWAFQGRIRLRRSKCVSRLLVETSQPIVFLQWILEGVEVTTVKRLLRNLSEVNECFLRQHLTELRWTR